MAIDMDEENHNIKDVIQETQKFLSQPGFESLINTNDFLSIEELKKYLAEKIAEMMEKNIDLLLSTLYRIDIDENKVKSLFSGKPKKNIPQGLAALIIERQLQKLYFRNKYKNEKL
jgi:hypothetical protein